MSSHTSLTEWEVRNMLELGVEHGVKESSRWRECTASALVAVGLRDLTRV